MNGLKSFVYLPHALVKAVHNRSSAFVLSGKDKSHTIAASATDELAGSDAEKYLLSWKNTFEYVIERAQVFKVRSISRTSSCEIRFERGVFGSKIARSDLFFWFG